MKKLLTLLLFFICANLMAQDYQYMYVSDKDGFVNVRESASANSAIGDTLFNLEVVKIYTEPIGTWRKTDKGFIHQSRLKELPEIYQAQYDSLYNGAKDRVFVTAYNCPQIVLVVEGLYQAQSEKGKGFTHSLLEKTETQYSFFMDAYIIHNIEVDKIITGGDAVTSPLVGIFSNRLGFIRSDDFLGFEYVFHRNYKGQICQNIICYERSGNVAPLTSKETSETIAYAKEVYNKGLECDKQEDEIEKQNCRSRNQASFEQIFNIHRLYVTGNKVIRKYYNLIIDNAQCDAGFCHSLDIMGEQVWAYDNQGDIVLE